MTIALLPPQPTPRASASAAKKTGKATLETVEGFVSYGKKRQVRYSLDKVLPEDFESRLRLVVGPLMRQWYVGMYGLVNAPKTVITVIGRHKSDASQFLMCFMVKTEAGGKFHVVRPYSDLKTERAAFNLAVWCHDAAEGMGWAKCGKMGCALTKTLLTTALLSSNPIAELQAYKNKYSSQQPEQSSSQPG